MISSRSHTPARSHVPLNNAELSGRLNELADLLELQNANTFRVRAYRTAAATLAALKEQAHEVLVREGTAGLMQLPGIGRSLARTIERLIHSDRVGLLDRLRGDSGAEETLATVPGIGLKTAMRIHEDLGIETLTDLETAAYDGRLQLIPGMGRKKIQAVRDSLAGRFRRRRRAPDVQRRPSLADFPSVAELLSIDEEYRQKAAKDRLIRIAPRRFNPTGEAWLPILHTHRGSRHYTALYSNTARAHELGTVKDWVVIYRDDHGGDGQWTVVTSRFGPLSGKRIFADSKWNVRTTTPPQRRERNPAGYSTTRRVETSRRLVGR